MFKKVRRIKAEFLGLNSRNVGFIFPSNPRKFYKLADDKVLAKNILEKNGIPCAITYATIDKIGEIPLIWKKMDQYDKLAIKPANGSGGQGIKILTKDEEGEWISSGKPIEENEIFLFLANIIMGFFSLGTSDCVLIEECIIPHDCFHTVYPEGVADLRVILYRNEIVMGMLRVPTDKSDGKANLHQGGMGIGINLETGKMTDGYDGTGYYSSHPDSGSPIRGVTIPFWEEILELSLLTAKHFPLKYLGVDIVIDKVKGPLVMEVNVRPGLGIQMVNKAGLKPILENIEKNQLRG
ncbi:MAG: alpha-L-glutamate ligase-like protein [Crocinitomix sp.]|jgi:alpha-L-glutamate ligase-like protein